MKIAPMLLSISVAANVALVAFFLLRSPRSPGETPGSSPPTTQRNSGAGARADGAFAAALASGDAAALEAAGVSAEVARDLTVGRAVRRAVERGRAARVAPGKDSRWWRGQPASPHDREATLKAQRELSDTLAAAFGFDPLFSRMDAGLDFLPPEKHTALRQITQDYDEMMAKFSAGGIQLASDRERLRLLRAERERDIAALLTPEELADYELRTSPSAALVRSRYGEGIETEEEFRTLFALQKAFDEKYSREGLSGRIPPEVMQARLQAERQLQADIRAALGEERYAAMRRATDPDLRTLDSLTARLGLPPSTTNEIATSREALAAESQRINSDTTLTPEARRARLQELGQRAKAQLTQTLGSEGADAYAQRSPWLSLLQTGMAYSTSPENARGGLAPFGSQSVFPVPPPSGPGGGGPRTISFTAATGATYAVPVAGPANAENVQITSITMHDPAGGSAPPVNVGTIMIAPATPPAAEPAPKPKQ